MRGENQAAVGRALAVAGMAGIGLIIIVSCTGCGWLSVRMSDAATRSIDGRLTEAEAAIGELTEDVKALASGGYSGSGFDWALFWGPSVMGLVVGGVLLLFGPTRGLWPVAVAGGVGLGVVLVAEAYKWQIIIGVVLIAALTFAFMWLRRSRTLKKLVRQLQGRRENDPTFKQAMNDAVTLSKPETALIDKMRGK